MCPTVPGRCALGRWDSGTLSSFLPMYVLQPYDGPSTRHVCPRCGDKKSFTLYIDESGNKLADNVGRCDHSSACGYHYTPKQYFADHPDLRHARFDRASQKPKSVPPKPKLLCTIPISYVERSVRTDRDSHLITFLRTILPSSTIEALIEDYRIGVARNGATIFFQLDIEGRCRTGKVMKYDPETGHRIKDPDTPSRITWVHSLMRQAGQLPASWNLMQCLFGEHLLKEHPDKPVAIVESEKTAVICAGLMPKYVWLATGGKSCVNDRLLVLSGHKVVAFPDVDGYQEWIEKLAKYSAPNPVIPGLTRNLDITVSPILQQNATPEDLAAHIDIADWLIRTRCKPVAEPAKEPSITFLKTARYIDPAYHAELEALITDFELELI